MSFRLNAETYLGVFQVKFADISRCLAGVIGRCFFLNVCKSYQFIETAQRLQNVVQMLLSMKVPSGKYVMIYLKWLEDCLLKNVVLMAC